MQPGCAGSILANHHLIYAKSPILSWISSNFLTLISAVADGHGCFGTYPTLAFNYIVPFGFSSLPTSDSRVLLLLLKVQSILGWIHLRKHFCLFTEHQLFFSLHQQRKPWDHIVHTINSLLLQLWQSKAGSLKHRLDLWNQEWLFHSYTSSTTKRYNWRYISESYLKCFLNLVLDP